MLIQYVKPNKKKILKDSERDYDSINTFFGKKKKIKP
jgi:hypothetical protein